jgi:hypothetical protein
MAEFMIVTTVGMFIVREGRGFDEEYVDNSL